MERAIKWFDPWQAVLNVPCWRPFMWETVLSYGSSYNEAHLRNIEQLQFEFAGGLHAPSSFHSKANPLTIHCEP